MLYKNTFKKIKKSFGRYISIFIIVMVGVGFSSGIRSTSPDINKVADHHYDKHQLMDYKIVSTLGLTHDDVNAIKALDSVETAIPSYSLDTLSDQKAIRIHALEESVNTVELVDGRMPENNKECVADSKNYKIGDTVKIESDLKDKIKNTEFTVVGTVDSVLYLSEEYGSTTIGDGTLASFIFVRKDNFLLETYTEIYVTAKGAIDSTVYSDEYEKIVSQLEDELVSIKAERENARYQEIYNEANSKIIENEEKLNDKKETGEQKLTDAKNELDSNAKKLADAKDELLKSESDLQASIDKQNADFQTAQSQIAEGWNQINTALNQYNIKQEEIDTTIEKLNIQLKSMKAQLSKIPSESKEYEKLKANIEKYSASHEGLVKLKESIDTLTVQEQQLNDGIARFNTEITNAKLKIENGKTEIAENEEKITEGYEEYNKNLEEFNVKIADAQTKINDAKNDLSELEKAKWIIFDRDTVAGYSMLKFGIEVIANVASVFPIIFIVIIMLMTSNSMTRMIEEERGELGTLTSLGYSDFKIISTYLLYVLSASGIGVITGFFVGCRIIPPILYANFTFSLPTLVYQYDISSLTFMLAVTLTVMTVVTIFACNKELKHKPATLLRPVPPKNGKTILLEKVGFIWKNLSFTWKVTMRNMFRYKKRALMTIIGVGTCTALILVGFGLRDSTNGVAKKQYGEILKFDNQIILKDEICSLNDDLSRLLEKEKLENPLLIRQAAFRCDAKDKSQDVYVIVPENEEIFDTYYNLRSLDNESDITLNDNGVVITEKFAEIFKVEKGDTIVVKDADDNDYELTVADVAQNYSSNYIYMNKEQYSKVFGQSVSYNAIVSNHSSDKKILAQHLIDSELVVKVVFTDDILSQSLEGDDNMKGIIVLLVVVSSLLAVVVLYNLTLITISERTREIATLKVLGFRDVETNAYIYREAAILTLLSIIVGLILGVVFHGIIVDVVEGDNRVLFNQINWQSYLFASLFTMIFSVVMQVFTYFKLQKIDMIESLKSVE